MFSGGKTKVSVRTDTTGTVSKKPKKGSKDHVAALEASVLGFGKKAIDGVIGISDAVEAGNITSGTSSGGVVIDKPAAWVDDDDHAVRVDLKKKNRLKKLRKTEEEQVIDGSQFSQRLRSQFEKVHGKAAWAERSDETLVDEDGDVDGGTHKLLKSSKALLAKRKTRLVRGVLDINQVKDANAAQRSEAVVQAVDFHPSAPAMLTAGLDKTLRIFQVDGKKNALLQSTYIANLPMYSAAFVPDGTEIIMSGRRKYFYSFDLESASVMQVKEIQGQSEKSLEKMWVTPDSKMIIFTGRDGRILLVSRKTKQLIGKLKMNQSCRQLSFSKDGEKMFSTGDEGRIYVWDLRNRVCINKFQDDGSLCGTAIASSPNGQYLAVGSSSGIVNVYDDNMYSSTTPQPVKIFKNLTTTIDNLSFNHDSNLLCFSSRMKKNALRVVHVPSFTVFKNWPSQKTTLQYPHTMAFSPNSGYLAVGNDKGTIPLFRLNFYDKC